MTDFLWGANAMAALVAAVFFLRFRRETGDRLFSLFALAFGALALSWLLPVLLAPARESSYLFYLVRLAAFLLIIAAIVDKNRSSPSD